MSQVNAPYPTESSAEPMPASANWHPHPLLALIACVLASGLAFAAVNAIYPYVPREDLPPMGPYPSAELIAQYNKAEIAFRTANDAINGSILGALTGLLLGAFTSRSRALGAIVGLVSGAAAGALGGYFGGNLVAGAINSAGAQSTVQSVGFLTLLWGLIVAIICGALAAIHNARQIPFALIAGLVIAGIAAVVYNVAASVAFPMSNLVLLTPNTTSERLVWALSFGIILGIGIAFGFRPGPAKQVAAQQAP